MLQFQGALVEKGYRPATIHLRLACMATLLVLLIWGCRAKRSETTDSIADIQKREGIPVTTVTVSRRNVETIERSGGTVEGYQQSLLTSAIPATVSSIKVRVGQYVDKNAVIMTLSPTIASPYTIAKANAETLEKSQERAQVLAQQGGIPQEMLDNLETGIIAARENLEAARKTENIVAPFGGIIVEIYPAVNTVVWPGRELIKIASLGKVRVRMSVSETVVDRYAVGQKAIIRDSDSTATVGVVEKVSLAGDESNHTFTVEAVFDNTHRKLRPGMYVLVDVVVQHREGVIALPFEVIMTEDTDKYVYVVEDNIVHRRSISTGIRGGGFVEITGGLNDGDRIVATGASLLGDGVKVKVVESK